MTFFFSCVYSMILRGYLIDPAYLKAKIQELNGELSSKSVSYGFKLINYFQNTLRPQPNWFVEQNFKVSYAGYWITDKSLFQKRVDTFENSNYQANII